MSVKNFGYVLLYEITYHMEVANIDRDDIIHFTSTFQQLACVEEEDANGEGSWSFVSGLDVFAANWELGSW